MKILVLIALSVTTAASITPELEQMIKEHMKEICVVCKSKVGATDDDVAVLLAHQVPTTETGRCFLACIYKMEKFLDADGNIDKEGSLAAIEKIKALDEAHYVKSKEATENCLERISNGSNECETAANMHQCMLSEKHKLGMETINLD